MDMAESLTRISAYLAGAILIIAGLSLVFGYKLFRFISAAVAFFLTAIGISALLGPTASRAVVVTAFIVLGILAAFLAYQWTAFGAFILCASVGYGFASYFTEIIWVCLIAALLFGFVSVRFPISSVVLTTAVWGAVTIGTDGVGAVGIETVWQRIIIIVCLAAAGIGIQYYFDRDSIREELSRKDRKVGKAVKKTPATEGESPNE